MSIFRRMTFSVLHGMRGGGALARIRRRYDRDQWVRPEELARVQREALRAFLGDIATTSPYYRELLDGGASVEPCLERPERWLSIPLLDKATIRANAPRICAEGLGKGRLLPNATSGSTGESLRFFLDAASKPHRAAATHRFLAWAGLHPTDRQAKLWGARFDEPRRQGWRDRLKAWLEPGLFLSSYRLSEIEMEEYSRRLREFAPLGLTSYPSPLVRFAEFCTERGIRLPSLRAIQCSAEQLHPHQRAVIEQSLGVPVFDRYGSREFGNLAMECELHDGLHVAVDRVVLEILDAHGAPCPPGVRGEIVVTDLDNRAMPFLRYRTGDLGVWAEGPCACGRTLPRLARLEGRVLDLVRTPGGHVISGTFWPQIVKQSSDDVELYQVEQRELSRIELRLKTTSGRPLTTEAEERLRTRLREHAPDLGVELVYVEDIPCSEAGKRRTVISHLA